MLLDDVPADVAAIAEAPPVLGALPLEWRQEAVYLARRIWPASWLNRFIILLSIDAYLVKAEARHATARPSRATVVAVILEVWNAPWIETPSAALIYGMCDASARPEWRAAAQDWASLHGYGWLLDRLDAGDPGIRQALVDLEAGQYRPVLAS
ncbi:hypothetical protein [Emcibacter sp. SYSU 3D8]|uniref:hypothetical protein n=1 Tax=Emcibacter sp. SYSU 3D8 TaxID=3133969 RepID=UPI0031FF261C